MLRAGIRTTVAVLAVAILCGPAFADPAGRAMPERFAAGALDGAPVIVEDAFDGTVWSAWAYRDGAEYAIAVSLRGADGAWTEPVFLGRDDGLDQVDPSLAIDATGTAYLAFAVRETGEIQLSLLVGGTAKWSSPARVSADDEIASSPVVRIVADRIVLGYATDAGTRLIDFALVPGTGFFRPHGIQEGPDVIDPLGRDATAADGQSGEEAGTSNGTAWRGAKGGSADGVEVRHAGQRTNDDRQR